MKIRVFVTGRSYHSADQLPDSLDLPEQANVDDALEHLGELLGEGASVPPSCLLVVSGQHLGTVSSHSPRELKEGDEVTLIAPVAGG